MEKEFWKVLYRPLTRDECRFGATVVIWVGAALIGNWLSAGMAAIATGLVWQK